MPTASTADSTAARQLATRIISGTGQVVLGKETEIRLAISCLLAGGHLLVEDVPGVGKTLLARSLAAILGLQFTRIQFTSDMLPSDIIGSAIFRRRDEEFVFHPGPIFSQLVLADEINRAPPKVQSALLEAMEEHQVSIDGKSHRLPTPFFVIATQNPLHQAGTFPLPESQLDRFLMCIGLGYPAAALERKLLRGEDRRSMLEGLAPLADGEAIAALKAAARAITVSDAALDYVQALLQYTRSSGGFVTGLSPRAGIDLLAAARAWAMVSGHDGVYPQDIQAVFPAVAGHRLQPLDRTAAAGADPTFTVLSSVAIP